MRKAVIVMVMFFVSSVCAQNIFDKAIDALKKGVDKKIEKEYKRITGEGASEVTNLNDAKNSLFGEAWVNIDQSNNIIQIIRFNKDYTYNYSIQQSGNQPYKTDGKWMLEMITSTGTITLLLDDSKRLYFTNARQLDFNGFIYRKTPDYLIR